MKKFIFQLYIPGSIPDKSAVTCIAERIHSSVSVLQKNYNLTAAVIPPESFTARQISAIIPEGSEYIPEKLEAVTGGACRQIYAGILHSILRNKGLTCRLAEAGRINFLTPGNSITGRIKKIIINSFKKNMSKNVLTIIYNNTVQKTFSPKLSAKNREMLFPLNAASLLSVPLIEIYISPDDFFCQEHGHETDPLTAREVTHLESADLVPLFTPVLRGITNESFISYAGQLSIEILFKNIQNGEPLLHIKNNKSTLKTSVRAVYVDENIARIIIRHSQLPRSMYLKLFEKFSQEKINITHLHFNTIVVNDNSVSFCVRKQYLGKVLMLLEYNKTKLDYSKIIADEHLDMISITGSPYETNSRFISVLCGKLENSNTAFEVAETTETKISLLVSQDSSRNIEKMIKKEFIKE